MILSSHRKDYYAGALMVLVGLSAAYAGQTYKVGTLNRMGPGFFPLSVGLLLALVGTLMVWEEARLARRSHATAPAGNVTSNATPNAASALETAPHHLPDYRGVICIILGIVVFYLLARFTGIIPATFAIVFIAALGDRANSLRQAGALALVMSVIALLVFWWALQVQLPLFY